MDEVSWIKLYLGLFDDIKIKKIRRMPDGNDMLIVWIFLLIQAGKCNAGGYIYITETIPFSIEDLAEESGIKINTVKLAIECFTKLNMIEVESNGKIFVKKFALRQNLEKIMRNRELTKIRMQKYRKKIKDNTKDNMENNTINFNDKKDNCINVTQNCVTEASCYAAEKKRIEKNRIDKDKNKKEEEVKCGDRVKMLQKEYEKLTNEHGQSYIDDMIDTMNNWLLSKGKTYKNYYRALLNWIKRDVKTKKKKGKKYNKEWDDKYKSILNNPNSDLFL